MQQCSVYNNLQHTLSTWRKLLSARTGGPIPFPSRRSSTTSPVAACPSRFSLARTKPRLFRAGKASQEARVACERRPFVDAFLGCSPFECRGPCLARSPLPLRPRFRSHRRSCSAHHLRPPPFLKHRPSFSLLVAAEAFHCRASSPVFGTLT